MEAVRRSLLLSVLEALEGEIQNEVGTGGFLESKCISNNFKGTNAIFIDEAVLLPSLCSINHVTCMCKGRSVGGWWSFVTSGVTLFSSSSIICISYYQFVCPRKPPSPVVIFSLHLSLLEIIEIKNRNSNALNTILRGHHGHQNTADASYG